MEITNTQNQIRMCIHPRIHPTASPSTRTTPQGEH